jgi:hypothetical protein
MKGKKLDDIISKKLANLNPKVEPHSWELFEEKLDAAMSAGEEPSLPDTSFDEMIFGKLSGLQSQQDPQAWARFEEKLDKVSPDQPVSVSSFDQMIATQLRRQQPAYNHSHWLLLKKRLDWISFVTNRLAFYKVSELVVVLVLLFYLGQSKLPAPEPATQQLPIADQPLNKADFTDEAASTLEESTPPVAETGKEISRLPLEEQASVPALTALPSKLSEVDLELSDRIVLHAGGPAKQGEENKQEKLRLISELLPLKGVGFKVLPQSSRLAAERFALSFEPGSLPVTAEDLRLADLADIKAEPLVPERFVSLASLIKPVSSKPLVNFSMMGAFDYNRILTPENKEFRLADFDRYEAGYGGGFLVGFEKRRLGIQTGGIYSFKKVRPFRVVYLEGSFDRGYLGEILREYDYSTISIPLNLTYDLIKNGDWRVYALAGASLNVVYEANYFVVLNRGKNSGGYGLAGSNFGPASTANTQTQLDEVKFPRGWFQGGSFAENSYLTTNIGFGVERFLEDRWSVFAQPTYQHGLIFVKDGLGPFKDQLRTMSFFTGIRVRLIK